LSAWSGACASFTADAPTPTAGADAAPAEGGAADARSDPDAADGGDGGDGNAMPTTVVITTKNGVKFAIDATEVTVARFNAFRASRDAGGVFPECPGKVALGPNTSAGCNATTDADQPVTCVDWCDAKAYCQSLGKRLCGKIGGGPLVRGTEADPNVDEWARACGGPVGSAWPYGGQPMATACNTQEAAQAAPVSVATLPSCMGGEPRLFDMSGNVNEWEDACVAADGGTPRTCLLRGGSYKHPTSQSSCNYVLLLAASTAASDVGIRCCKDL
jgi:sulfatase modifying factor 1